MYVIRPSALFSFFPNPPSPLPRTHTVSTPADGWNLPARQSTQAVTPEIGEYFPTKHQRVTGMCESLCFMYGQVGEKPAAQDVQVPPIGPAFPAVQFEYCDTHHTHTYNVNENGRAW